MKKNQEENEKGWETKPPEKTQKEAEEEITESSEHTLIRKVSIGHSGKNKLIRIPNEIEKAVKMEKGDQFVFTIKLDRDNNPLSQTFSIEKKGVKK